MPSRGSLALLPHTRKGLVFFFSALFMLSIALQYAAAMAPKSAFALSGAVFTSNFDGTGIDLNIYDTKGDVYLTGGPCNGGSHLDDGQYYYQVTSPNGVLLSSDAASQRLITISGGFITASSGHVTHDVACTSDPAITVQLLPYLDTPNPGGEYKLTVATKASVEEKCKDFDPESTDPISEICGAAESKSDNYKVGANGNLKIVKTIEGGPEGVSGSFPVSVDCGQAGTFTGTIVFPTPGFITFHDIATGAVCTVTEGTKPAPPPGFTYGPPTYTGNPATIGDGTTVTVGVVNHLNLIPAPAITIAKGVSTSAAGPFHDEITVATGTTVHYRIVITNTGNVPLTGVTLTDSIYDLADVCENPVPTSLAVGASYTCNYAVVIDESGTVHNIATVGSDQTDDKNDDATVNASTEPTLTIDKSNNAPIVNGLPTVKEGDTVTFTLDYTHTGDDAANGVIKDVLPNGLTYVANSATNSSEFIFDGYDAGTRTLTWLASKVSASGSVTYQATVDAGAAGLVQPLENVATIDSDDTAPDTGKSHVFVAPPVQAETSVPTAPRSDIGSGPENTTSGGSMLLILLALAGIALAVVFVAPTPAAIRKRKDR